MHDALLDRPRAAPIDSEHFQRCFADVDVHVRSCPELVRALALVHGRVEEGRVGKANDVITLTVRRTSREWLVDQDGQPSKPLGPSNAALGDIAIRVSKRLGRAVAARSRHCFMRGIALERDDRALAIGGGLAVGKSTIGAHLIARGWRLVSDDYAIIDARNCRTIPYHKLMALAAGALDLVPHSFRSALEASPWFACSGATDINFYAVDPAVSCGADVWSPGGRLAWLLLARRNGLVDAAIRTAYDPAVGMVAPHSVPQAQLRLNFNALRRTKIGFLDIGAPLATTDLIEDWCSSA